MITRAAKATEGKARLEAIIFSDMQAFGTSSKLPDSRACIMANRIKSVTRSKPGPIPAKKSAMTDCSVTNPYTIIGIDGGIRIPKVPPAARRP